MDNNMEEIESDNYTGIDWSEGVLDKTPCPECKEMTLYVFTRANGPDDYDQEWRCPCGFFEQA